VSNFMKPSAFDYIRVESLDEAVSVLADSDLEAKILAGGQSLLPILNMRLAQPKALVDINRLAALQMLEQLPANASTGDENGRSDGTLLQIGALVRQRQLERNGNCLPLKRAYPLGSTAGVMVTLL